MSGLVLVIGTKNYSSWSLRPWLLLKHLDLEFTERQYHFGTPEFESEIPKISPTRRVPVLLHDELRVWESVAICEYASELAGGRGWPAEQGMRALARAVAPEMHAGFGALRGGCPDECARRGPVGRDDTGARTDLRRIDAIWSGCRRDPGERGSMAFRPLQHCRRHVCPGCVAGQDLRPGARPLAARYLETVLEDQQLRQWIRAARAGTDRDSTDEVGAGA